MIRKYRYITYSCSLIIKRSFVAIVMLCIITSISNLSAQNLLTNPDFENGTAGWTVNTPGGQSTQYLNCGNINGYVGNGGSITQGYYSVTEGCTYTLNFDGYKHYGTTGWAWVELNAYDTDSGSWISLDSEGISITLNSWNSYSINILAPAGSDVLQVYIGAGGGSTCRVDCMSLTESCSNLLVNPGFENGTTNWSTSGPASVSTNNSACDNNHALIGDGGSFTQNYLSANESCDYTLTFQAERLNIGSGWAGVAISAVDTDNGWTNLLTNDVIISTAGWNTYTLTITTPANTDALGLWMGTGSGGSFKVDCLVLTENCSSGGNTSSCTSTLINNPDFENNLTDWTYSSNVSTSSDAYSGSIAAQISGGTGGVLQTITTTAGETHSAQAYAKRVGNNEDAYLGIEYYDSSNNWISSHYGYIVSTIYEPVTVSATAPIGATSYNLVGWKEAGNDQVFIDDICLENWNLTPPSCSSSSCPLEPSYLNYIFAIDDVGDLTYWMDYDNSDLILCDNGDGTMTIKGNIINGQDADFGSSYNAPCGSQDGWIVDIDVFDKQTWSEFQGSYEVNSSCPNAYLDLDYYDCSGTLTGTGCNSGRTLTIVSPSIGYRLQIGDGGNSHNCGFGMSTWFYITENGNQINADIYANLNESCYTALTTTSTCTINISALGSCGAESLELRLNGTTAATYSLSTSFQTFTYSGYNGTDAISVYFQDGNNGCDFNARIDYIEVSGYNYQTETDGTHSNTTCNSGEWLWCTGTIDFGALGTCGVEICDDSIDNDGDGDIDCDDSYCQSIILSSPVVSACIDHPLRDVATVTLDVTWNNGPSGDDIEVIFGDKIETIFVSSGATSPQTVTFMTTANGYSNNYLEARWKNNTAYCNANTTFDLPSSCSNDFIACNVLYLCGAEKPYDGDPWDHGIINYIDEVNGSYILDAIFTKNDASGMGTYDVNNQNTFINVVLNDYDLIIVSATTENNIASDLVDVLKNFSGSILNSNYLLLDDLGLSNYGGSFSYQTHAYTDNTTQEEIYNFDNINPSYNYVFTHGVYTTEGDGYLYADANNQSTRNNSILFHYDATDNLPGITGGHGSRTFLGYHMNGIYANPVNGGALPAPTSSYFSPEKHLTLIGKEMFDLALVSAGSGCNLVEICDNGIDDDGDGLIDCDDPYCGAPTSVEAGPAKSLCTGSSIPNVILEGSASGGTSSLTYTWTPTTGLDNPNIPMPAASPTTTTTYTLTVTGDNGCTSTDDVTVNVTSLPTASASGETICSGESATLLSTISGGSGSLSYQWQISTNGNNGWSDITGATNATYTTPTLIATSYYRLVVSTTGGGCSDVITNTAAVTVELPSITITADSDPEQLCSASAVTLTVNEDIASGDMIDYSGWTVGTGRSGDFTVNGSNAENHRIIDTDPWGNSTVVWEARPDATSNADGGWNTALFPIDHTKMYRVSVWVNRKVVGNNGRFYLGTRGYGSTNGLERISNGTTTTNPYFWHSATPPTTLQEDEWVLVVGHIYPSSHTGTTNHTDSGRYTTSEGKVAGINNDYQFLPGTTTAMHRSYLYYSTDVSVRQQWVYPRFDIVDGTEPSIDDLLSGFDVNGGLGQGASWEWYEGSCGGTPVGTGTSITVNPTSTTTYYVRAEGDCNTTACQSVTVTVSDNFSVDLGYGQEICYDESANITANVTGGQSPFSYSWEGPEDYTSTTQVISVTGEGAYALTVTDDNGCSTTDIVTLQIKDTEPGEIGNTTVDCPQNNPATIVSIQDASFCNYIKNHQVINGLDDWHICSVQSVTDPVTGAVDTNSVLSGKNSAFIDMNQVTANDWHHQVLFRNNTIIAGETYNISFMAKATGPKPVRVMLQLGGAPYTNYYSETVNLTTTPNNYSITYTATESSDNINLSFNVGSNLEDLWLDNIVFVSNSCAEPSIDYQWESRESDGNGGWTAWTTIPGATSSTYDPPVLNNTTQYRRLSSVTGCDDYSPTNIIQVDTCPCEVVASATGDTICSGQTATLISNVSGGTGTASYQWQQSTDGSSSWTDISGANSSDYTTPILIATSYYRLVVTYSGPGCPVVITDVATVTVNEPAAASAVNNGPITCDNTSVTLTASPAGATYLWSNGDSNQSPSVTTSGTYTVTITDTNGCTNTAETSVTENTTPTPIFCERYRIRENNVWSSWMTFDGNCTIEFCEGDGLTDFQFDGGPNINTGWVWTDESGNIDPEVDELVVFPNLKVSDSGTYTGTLTDENGCISTLSYDVIVYPNPIAEAGDDVVVCNGSSISLTASGGDAYLWNDNSGSTTPTITVSPSVTTTYTVTVTNSNGCSSIDSVLVTAASISVDIGTEQEICDGSTANIDLNVTGGNSPYSYDWEGPNDFSANTEDVSVTEEGAYSVTVTDNNGCTSSDMVAVQVMDVEPGQINDTTIDCPDNDPAIITSLESPSFCNYIKNHEAIDNIDDWHVCSHSSITNPITATLDENYELSGKNSAYLEITENTGVRWHHQLIFFDNEIIEGETYTISFEAKATGTKNVRVLLQVNEEPWDIYFSETVTVGTTANSYTLTTTATSSVDNLRLLFDLGENDENIWMDNIVFKNTSCSEPSIDYQWESRESDGNGGWTAWTTIPGATGATYDPPVLNSTTQYRRLSSVTGCNDYSPSNVIQVDACPCDVTASATGETVCTGETATLISTVSGGTGAVSYQWQSSPNGDTSWTDISGATNANYTTSGLLATSYYRLVVSHSGPGCSDVTTNTASVTVEQASITLSASSDPQHICSGGSATISINENIASGGLIDYSTWTTGSGKTGSSGEFTVNGTNAENHRITDTDPWGNSTVVWEARPDANSDADGGWNTNPFSIDHTKMYRVSVWVNRKVIGNDGVFHLGTRGYGSTDGLERISDGSTQTNPYFWISDSPPTSLQENEWVLVVGHIFPSDHNGTTNHNDSGRYTTSDGKIGGIDNDYQFLPGTTTSLHRSYLYFCTDVTVRQQWAYPRFDIIDGTEPSVDDLLSGFDVNGGLGQGATWEWYQGSCGGTSIGTGASLVVTPTVTTTYYVRAEGDCNTTSCEEVTVIVNDPPAVDATNDGPLTCTNTEVNVTATPADMNYLWQDGSTTQSIIVNSTGTYAVTVTDSNGCTAKAESIVIEDTTAPIAEFAIPDQSCEGDIVTFLATDAGGGASYSWTFGDYATPTTASGIGPHDVTYSGFAASDATQSSSVNLTVTSDNGCTDSQVSIVKIRPIPEVETSFVNPSCDIDNGQLIFDITVGNNNGTTVSIDGGNTYTGTGLGTSGVYTVSNLPSGEYHAFIRYGSTQCPTDLGIIYLEQEPSPQATLVDESICEGESITLNPDVCESYPNINAQRPLNTGGWSNVFHDGNQSGLTGDGTLCFTIADLQDNSLQMIGLNDDPNVSNSFADIEYAIYLFVKPSNNQHLLQIRESRISKGNVYSSPNSFVGSTLCIRRTGTLVEYLMDDVVLYTSSAPSNGTLYYDHSIHSGAGDWTGGYSKFSDISLCAKASDLDMTYAWSTGAISGSIEATNNDTYTVTVTDYNGCTSETSATVSINEIEESATNSGPITCQQLTVQLEALPSGKTYEWSGPNGFSSNDRTPDVTEAGTYTVTISDAATGCSNQAQTIVLLESEGTIDNINSGCTTEDIVVDYTINGSTTEAWIGLYEVGSTDTEYIIWQWVSTIPGTGSVTFVNHGINSGTYEARLFSGDAHMHCETSTFTLNPIPEAAASNDGPLTCDQTNVILTATPTGMTYLWSDGSTQENNTISVAGEYTVTVTDSNGCTASATTVVTENLVAPVAEAGDNITICLGASIDLTATGGSDYIWDDTAASTSATINVSPNATTTYTVIVTDTNGCSATDEVVVTVTDAPAQITLPESNCADLSSIYEAHATEGASYLWDFAGATTADGDYDDIIEDVIWPETFSDTTINVSLTVTTANGCVSTATQSVTVFALPEHDIQGDMFIQENSKGITYEGPEASSYRWSVIEGDAVLMGATDGPTCLVDFLTQNSTLQLIVTNHVGCEDTLLQYAAMLNLAQCNFYDNFGQVAYNNSHGTQDWTPDPWVEFNDDNNPSSGEVRIIGNRLRLQNPNSGPTVYIERPVNLVNIDNAILAFDLWQENGVGNVDLFEVDIFDGSVWTTIYSLSGKKPGGFQPSFDISAYANENTIIRFKIPQGYRDNSKATRIDDVIIYGDCNLCAFEFVGLESENTCEGVCEGVIFIDPDYPVTGDFNLSYTYNGSVTNLGPYTNGDTVFITGLCAGTYSDITISRIDGQCSEIWPQSLTIGEAGAEWEHVTHTDNVDNCDGDCNGSFTVDANLGLTGEFMVSYTFEGTITTLGPYDFAGDILIDDLCPGVYTNITITGTETGCSDIWPTDIEIIIERPEATIVSFENDFCQENMGEAIIQVSGGLAPYTIDWHSEDGTHSGTTTLNNAGQVTIDGLIGGHTYCFTVTDMNGCSNN